ncbi:MAG TPA: HWE histidine kinase domain-containing protein [Micropepsaceae bacterium]|nr:HWE histidine kinase domain-containing protein [Micropepsaceae bacterium]
MIAQMPPAAALPGDAALQIILETALDPVVIMDSDGKVAAWSALAEETFGWSAEEALNRKMADLIIPDRYRQDHNRGLRHYNETGDGPLLRRRVEITALRRSGEEFPIELSISPFERAGARVFVGFLRDITDRHGTHLVLERQARQAILLGEVTALAAETKSVSNVLQLCLDAVCELSGWPVGHAYVPSEDGSLEFIPTAIWHVDDEKYGRLRQVTMNSRFRSGVGLPGMIWQTQNVRWVADISQAEANIPRFRELSDLNVRAAFGVPIKSGDKVIAVLEFFNDVVMERDPQVLLIARTFGDQVGRVLERREVLQRQEMLVAELNHRVKNMLAVVLAIAMQTARGANSLELFKKDFSGRLVSLGRSYSLLTASEWKQTLIKDIVQEIVTPHVAAEQLEFDGPEISLSAKATLAMSMILHELVTNAVKYGALSVPAGRIALRWTLADPEASTPRVALVWEESGLSDLREPEQRSGFGSKLIEMSARQELGGRVDVTYRREGIRYDFRFPFRYG